MNTSYLPPAGFAVYLYHMDKYTFDLRISCYLKVCVTLEERNISGSHLGMPHNLNVKNQETKQFGKTSSSMTNVFKKRKSCKYYHHKVYSNAHLQSFQLRFLRQTLKIRMCDDVYSSRHVCIFIRSSVVPGVCRTSAGSGARQDDAGGLSTSSSLTLHPI